MLKFTETSQPIGQKKYVELSKDIFIFSYLCGGINFTDIANLTQENIVNGRLHYIRQKTGKLIKIGIPQEAMQIIKKYTELIGYSEENNIVKKECYLCNLNDFIKPISVDNILYDIY